MPAGRNVHDLGMPTCKRNFVAVMVVIGKRFYLFVFVVSPGWPAGERSAARCTSTGRAKTA